MTRHYTIHNENPQLRLLQQVIEDIKKGAVVIVPTDCCYVMCCKIGDKESEAKIAYIRGYQEEHTNRLALLLADISQGSYYAEISNWAFKILKKATPGPYTFILPANNALPKRLHLKRKTIGIRIPDNKILLALLNLYNEPLYSSTLWLPEDEYPYFEPELIKEKFNNNVDIIIDGGVGVPQMSTVVSLIDNKVDIIREGRGDCGIFD